VKHRAVIGIEVSNDQIRAAYVRQSGSSVQLAGVHALPIPEGAVDEEGLLNAQVLGDVVRRLCMELEPKVSQVVMGLTNCSLVARVMEIPPVPDAEIRSVLRGEMDHYRILPAGQSAFDYFKLPDGADRDNPAAGEEPVLRILLMGAEERLVASYRATMDAANLPLAAVEPGSIALLRALYPVLCNEDSVASVVLSATGTDVFITHRGELQFYRRIDTGVPELRAPTLGAAPAGTQPRGGLLVGLGGSDEEVSLDTPEYEPYNRQAISLLMTEVQRSIDYYIREFPSAGETMLARFAIDAPDAAQIFEVLTQYLRTPAELASAVDALTVAPNAAAALRGAEAFRYTVAVGLALRGMGSPYDAAPSLDLVAGDRVVVERRMAPRAIMLSAAASSVILIGTIAAAIVVGSAIARSQRNLTQLRTELNALKAEHAAKVAMLERQKNLTEAIHRRSRPLREALDFVAASVARRAALVNLSIDANGVITISGEAPTPKAVADVMDTLNLSPSLEPVRMNNLARIDPNNGGGIHFDLQTNFVQPVVQANAAPPANQGPAGPQGGS